MSWAATARRKNDKQTYDPNGRATARPFLFSALFPRWLHPPRPFLTLSHFSSALPLPFSFSSAIPPPSLCSFFIRLTKNHLPFSLFLYSRPPSPNKKCPLLPPQVAAKSATCGGRQSSHGVRGCIPAGVQGQSPCGSAAGDSARAGCRGRAPAGVRGRRPCPAERLQSGREGGTIAVCNRYFRR